MLWVLRIPLMLLGAEWLLLFRAWLAPSVLFLLYAALSVRIALLYFVPCWEAMTITILIGVMPLTVVAHLKALFKGRSRAERDRYSLPATGEPWLLKATNSPRLSLLLELVIGTGAVLAFAAYAKIIYPPGMRDLSPQWTAWLSQNGAYFATWFGNLSIAGLVLWEMLHLPRQSPWLTAVSGYQASRAHSHALPQLPSVKELADEYKQQYE